MGNESSHNQKSVSKTEALAAADNLEDFSLKARSAFDALAISIATWRVMVMSGGDPVSDELLAELGSLVGEFERVAEELHADTRLELDPTLGNPDGDRGKAG